MSQPDLEDRVDRLEQLLGKVIAYARTTAVGRRILAILEIQ